MHDAALNSAVLTVEHTEEPGRFYAHLAQGLHAMAQPLTILRSSVVASTAPGISADRHRRYLDISTQQVERACGLFECLQDLVIARQVAADCKAFDLEELTAQAIEDHEAVFQSAGVSVIVTKKGILQPVLGDEVRTRQALCAALKIAASMASPDDEIELLMITRNPWVECVVRNRRAHGRNLDSSQHLSLSLAETNIRSQRGEYQCIVDPLCITWALPTQIAS